MARPKMEIIAKLNYVLGHPRFKVKTREDDPLLGENTTFQLKFQTHNYVVSWMLTALHRQKRPEQRMFNHLFNCVNFKEMVNIFRVT